MNSIDQNGFEFSASLKFCSCCCRARSRSRFHKKRNSIEGRCKDCKQDKANRPDLVVKRKARQKKMRDNNKERESARVLKWKKEHPERIRVRMKKWRWNKYREDPEFAIRQNLSSRLSKFVTGQNRRSIRVLVGCSISEVRAHLESLFKPGMTWKNYGKVWEIDHIRPCDSFNLLDPEQQALCNNWTNLQPLSKEENRRKSNTYVV